MSRKIPFHHQVKIIKFIGGEKKKLKYIIILKDPGYIKEFIQNGGRLEIPPDCPPNYRQLILGVFLLLLLFL